MTITNQACCAVALNRPGRHSTSCRSWTPRRSRLGSWLRDARAWWRARAEHDDRDEAGYGDQRCILELLPTKAWATWTELDKKWLDLPTFAEHIEDNLIDIVSPDGATMLEVSQSLQATTGAEVQRAERISNGEVKFRYVETISATAGQAGEFEVPAEFIIAIAPFEGAEPTMVTARFRYRLNRGDLRLSYALVRPDDVRRDAYQAHVTEVAETITAPVFQGRPA